MLLIEPYTHIYIYTNSIVAHIVQKLAELQHHNISQTLHIIQSQTEIFILQSKTFFFFLVYNFISAIKYFSDTECLREGLQPYALGLYNHCTTQDT